MRRILIILLIALILPASSGAFLTQSSLRTHRRSLGPRGFIGMGIGWAAPGTLDNMPVMLFDGLATNESMSLTFLVVKGFDRTVNPILRITTYSTDAPVATEGVFWSMELRYIAEGETTNGAVDETIEVQQALDTEASFLAENTRNITIDFELDASLMNANDTVFFHLTRNQNNAFDDYTHDMATSEMIFIYRGANGIDL